MIYGYRSHTSIFCKLPHIERARDCIIHSNDAVDGTRLRELAL
jgi:hypothetical protein